MDELIFSAECAGGEHTFTLAIYHPEYVERYDPRGLTEKGGPTPELYEAVKALLVASPAADIPSIRFPIFNTRRLPGRRLTGEAMYVD